MTAASFATISLALAVTAAYAGVLAPSRPSEIVMVASDNSLVLGNNPCPDPQRPVRLIWNPDAATGAGGVASLTIPPGQVLVLTSGSWRDAGNLFPLQPNRSYHPQLYFRSGGDALRVFSGAGAVTDEFGGVADSFDFGPGLVVRAGTTVCAVLGYKDGLGAGVVHLNGFFAKDK